MTELEYFKLALASLHEGGWYTWKTHDADGNKISPTDRMTYANIVVTKEGITKPTEAEVNAKIEELKQADADAINKKASGKQKLLDLGLSEAEIKSLLGV